MTTLAILPHGSERFEVLSQIVQLQTRSRLSGVGNKCTNGEFQFSHITGQLQFTTFAEWFRNGDMKHKGMDNMLGDRK
jgi:hypothetical protein